MLSWACKNNFCGMYMWMYTIDIYTEQNIHHNAHIETGNLSPAALNVYKSTDEVLLYFFPASSYLQLKQRLEKKIRFIKSKFILHRLIHHVVDCS